MSTPIGKVAHFCSDLVATPFIPGVPQAEKIEIIHTLTQDLGAIGERFLASNSPEYVAAGIKALSTIACASSLLVVAQGGVHTVETAKRVNASFQEGSCSVYATLKSRPNLLKNPQIRGNASEFGILGIIWRGIAAELLPQPAFALPATLEQDADSCSGHRDAFDIIVRAGRRRTRYRVQVKSQRNGYNLHQIGGALVGDIRVITPGDVLPRSKKPITGLIETVHIGSAQVAVPVTRRAISILKGEVNPATSATQMRQQAQLAEQITQALRGVGAPRMPAQRKRQSSAPSRYKR